MKETKTRYHFDNNYVDEPIRIGDIRLFQIGRRYCEPGEIIAAHLHGSWFELTIVTAGKGTVITNGERTPVSAGDIYLSFPCDIHDIHADTDARLEYDFFSFYSEEAEIGAALEEITRSHRGGESRLFRDAVTASLVTNAMAEFSPAGQPYAEQLLGSLFRAVLIYVIRNFRNVKSSTANVSEAEILCFQLMNYIDTHLYSIKRLDDVAGAFNYNYGYLSGLFKRTTGKTVSQYFQNRKMETARVLVMEGKKPISEIAEMLGYSLYSFSKAFKARYGVSPKAMQKTL